MPRIAVLPSAVADQIAAGEVVERPASVVKELVENALDAGATSIDVAIEDGGRTSIRVADDGSGMDREDVLLALERHATSKIRDAADLVGIASFGFRGEALPSIASVSEVEIDTAPASGRGTRVRTVGGAVESVEESARRRGTTVSVRRLFHNTPARRKFLRGVRSEWRAIADQLASLALLRRDLRLSVTHDGKSALAVTPARTLLERLGAIWGAQMQSRMLPVEDVHGVVHVSGLVERPGDVGIGSRRIFLSVNGRAVRDAGLVRAAESAYRSTLSAGLRPSMLLELTVPGDAVDVNVHPAKAEVRFQDRWSVERAVESAVRRALGSLASAPSMRGRGWLPTDGVPSNSGVMEVEALGITRRFTEPLFDESHRSVALPDAAAVATATLDSAEDVAAPPIVIPALVQLRNTYLACETDDGLVLIDQHSAHERVLYERFMHSLEDANTPSQRLLFPLTLHLGLAESEAFEAYADLFGRLGFETEEFGGHTLMVRSVPMPHPRFDAERCLRDTLAALAGDRSPSTIARHERLAATVACKAAVKAGDELAPAEMRALYVALAQTRLPAHDVHGRATIVRLGWDEVERRFGRR